MERDRHLTLPRLDEPLYFGTADRPLAGWLHRPPHGMECSVAVVLCAPFGSEALCTYRMLRTLAGRLAASGCAVLRFDYEATGSSSGSTHELNDSDAWQSNILAALTLLQRALPDVPCALAGVRLGGLLVLNAAEHLSGLAGLLLIAPPMSGKQFLRETHALHRASGLGDDGSPDRVPQAFGYPLPPKLVSFINTLELYSDRKTGAERMLVIDRTDRPLGGSPEERLVGRARIVEVRSCPGIPELLVDAHLSLLPDEVLNNSVQFLTGLALPGRTARLPLILSPKDSLGTSTVMRSDDQLGPVRESFVFLDNDRRLSGILTEPLSNEGQHRRQLILVSSGANPGYGPNRLYVNIARRLATAGMTVLRLDIAGIGDSLPHPGEPDHVVYGTYAASDVENALNFLLARDPVPIMAGGVCSGGYHALLAAKAGAPIASMAIINPLRFAPVNTSPISDETNSSIAEAQRYGRSARSSKSWRKLLSGQVDLRRVLSVVVTRLSGKLRRVLRGALRHTRYHLADDMGWELERLAAKGVESLFVFSSKDPGAEMLAEFAGSTVRSLRRQNKLEIIEIPDADHTFTLVQHQSVLIESLAKKLVTENASREPRAEAHRYPNQM